MQKVNHLFTTTWQVPAVTNELLPLVEVVEKHNVNSMCWLLLIAFNKVFHSLK